MVLQKSPERAVVWGYGPEGEQIFNSSRELNLTSQFPNVRVFMAGRNQSDQEMDDLAQVQQGWSVPTKASVEGFSALCWIFGRLMFANLKHPVGLVQSCWGGTIVETWSSSRALRQCGLDQDQVPRTRWENRNSALWNAMIHPFLKMTLKGAIWYQGESNTKVNLEAYNCSFPAMIADWRSSFHRAGETPLDFPFGFVQVATGMKDITGYRTGSLADIRWLQTAGTGYAPNPAMNKTFMAVAMDLLDDMSPFHPVHPRDKYTVAHRLWLGARAVAYDQKDVHFLGPYPRGITSDDHSLNITYDQVLTICCPEVKAPCNTTSPWIPAPVLGRSSAGVQVSTAACPSPRQVAAVRYAWTDEPCSYKACLVYSAVGDLPAPPFTISL
ncbi:hypothetical protein NHX12_009198 [Muraenolepis orangiensis]|uniref:Sialate O-acetylesterase domain-containing protein n=1 Tax=Muraenolepis orangiensis TaxID=630683 RepID=A0A9Q0I8R9_9TELE|nr:hypothetical protein NHX12_009198 [Muraenolepis orangiensis]